MGKRLSKETQLKIVKEALAGIKVESLTRMYDIDPETIRLWIKNHRDEISMEDISTAKEQLKELLSLQEVEERFEQAKKLLEEKELEAEILRELLKKKNPAFSKKL